MEHITLSTSDTTLTITLNRPDKRNALHAGLVRELHAALRDAACDDELRAVVLTGAGSTFCAGADLSYLEEISRNSIMENQADSLRLMELLGMLRSHPLPIVARLNGHAIAGGCGLALACDIVIADERARLGFPEVRIGFVPAIVTRLLVDRVGPGRARELLLRGHLLSAQEAWTAGMVNHVVAPEALDTRVTEVVTDFTQQCSREAVALTKRLFLDIEDMSAAEAMRMGAGYNVLSRETGDFREGVASFLEKRPPRWSVRFNRGAE